MKLFWVDDESDHKNDWNSTNINVSMTQTDEAMSEEEVGQIALDVLENHESVCILAPVAGIQLHDIDISIHETSLTAFV